MTNVHQAAGFVEMRFETEHLMQESLGLACLVVLAQSPESDRTCFQPIELLRKSRRHSPCRSGGSIYRLSEPRRMTHINLVCGLIAGKGRTLVYLTEHHTTDIPSKAIVLCAICGTLLAIGRCLAIHFLRACSRICMLICSG